MQDLLSASYTCSSDQTIDHGRLKRDFPWIEFIGLVGFDTNRQRFVLLEMGSEKGNKNHETELSKREQEILQLVVAGYTNPQIASRLIISENTVKAHMQNIFAKLKVRSRTQAAMYAVQQGWVVG